MSVEVRGLADIVREAKEAIGKAASSAERMRNSATRLTGTLSQVEDMTDQLDAAHADLQGAVGLLSNGGPPLDDAPRSSHDTFGVDTVDEVRRSLVGVEQANRAK